MRALKVGCWVVVVFLLAPSRAQAVAYCLLGGFLVVSVFVTLAILGVSYKGIRGIFK